MFRVLQAVIAIGISGQGCNGKIARRQAGDAVELFDCIHSEIAEDDSTGFMSPNWCDFSAYKLSDNKYLVVQNYIEEREYEVYGYASSSNEASKLIREGVIERLGSADTITLSDGSTIMPEKKEGQEAGEDT